MAVFAHDKGLCSVLFKVRMNFIKSRIHPAVGVQIIKIILTFLCSVKGALVVCQTSGVKFLRPCKGFLKGAAVSAFISHRPDNHAGPVLISLHTALRPVNSGRDKFGVIRDCLAPMLKSDSKIRVPHKHILASLFHHLIPALYLFLRRQFLCVNVNSPMAFIVRLVNHIKAKLVVKLVSPGRIGVVAGADGIHVVLFHQLQIL